MKPTTAAFIIVCLMISIRSYSQVSIPFEKYTLPNGLEVILHEDHSVPIVAVNIWYHVGAAREQKGRTGFAHLFEHLMYEGSEHVRDGLYDEIVDGSGGSNNGSTGFDRTNYWLLVPKNYVEPALWLESDRMGFLLPGITQERLDLQRDVVKNERRQSYENQPYGQAFVKLFEAMYPEGVPYHWLPIGSQEDLTAASLEDVKGFFTTWYGPNNASLSIGGDFDPKEMKKLVEKYFGGIPRGPEVSKPVPIKNVFADSKHLLLEDKVQLPRLYLMWNSTPGYAVDDADLALLGYILTVGKNSRLYKSMVYEKQIAQDVSASQDGSELSGLFIAVTTARPGHTLGELKQAILDEVKNIVENGVTDRELERAKNGLRSGFIYQLQNVGGFGGKTDILNQYNVMLGDPGKLSDDLRRYERVTTEDIRRVAAAYLKDKAHVSLSVVPEGKTELQAKP